MSAQIDVVLSPRQIILFLIDLLEKYDQELTDDGDENSKQIDHYFSLITEILYKRKSGQTESNRALELVNAISETDFIMKGLNAMFYFSIEQRKQFTIIFTGSLAHPLESEKPPVVLWLQKNTKAIDFLLHFFEHPELAVSAGEMLRVCCHYSPIASYLIKPKQLDFLFSFFQCSHFDVSAESVATFRELLLTSPDADSYFHEPQPMIDRIQGALNEDSYATCRQLLKLIGELICTFPEFCDAYLHNEQNLISMMKIMVGKYRNIAVEAYHVFKLFVALEDKPEPISRILKANAQKLIQYIPSLIDDPDDIELQEEKEFVLSSLQMMSQ